MIEGLENISLPSIVEQEGIALSTRGNRFVGSCPFHSERTPSFTIFQDNKFKCFGCGEHGDAVDFVRKLHGLSFKDALKHLGICQQPLTPEKRKDIQKRKQQQARVAKFRDWQTRYSDELGILIRATRKVLSGIKNMADMESWGDLYHELESWEHHLDVLIYGDDQERLKLFKSVGDTSHRPQTFFKTVTFND